MLTPTIRIGSELSQGEKIDIINRMFSAQNLGERHTERKSLVDQYGITEGTINSLIAHETMRRMKNGEGTQLDSRIGEVNTIGTSGEDIASNPTQILQETTQARVYSITSLSGITEQMREEIIEEFSDVIREAVNNPRYDFYQDIEAISEYYNIDPNILEQFFRNRYSWIGAKFDELKKGRVLSKEEKLNIRLYVSGGVDEKDKKARRKEMAKQHGVSIRIIGPITAWKLSKHDDGVVLRKDEVTNEPNVSIPLTDAGSPESNKRTESNGISGESNRNTIDPDVSFLDQTIPLQAGQTLFNSPSGHTEEAIDKKETIFSKEDKVFIQELAGDFDLNNDEQRKLFLQDVFDLFPESTIDDIKKIIADFPDDTTHTNPKRSGEGMGALINYDNEIKNKWRQKLKEFIDENTDREKRATMKVLCLPGMECLEIPLYLELGFRPENIVGVEAGIVKGKKDPEVIARFQSNAQKYGIQTRVGMLEKILKKEKTTFDVVSLDFLGPISSSLMFLIRKMKLGPEVLVMTNYLGKREQKNDAMLGLNWMKYLQKINNIKRPNITELSDNVRNEANIYKQTKDFLETSLNEINEVHKLGFPEVSLSESREDISLYFVTLGVITRDFDTTIPKKIAEFHLDMKNSFGVDYFKEEDLSSCFEDYLADDLEKLFSQYYGADARKKLQMNSMVVNLEAIFNIAFSPTYNYKYYLWRLAAYKKYKYLSEVGQTSSPYYSDFISMRLLEKEYVDFCYKYRYYIEFFIQVIRSETKGVFSIHDKNGREKKPGEIINKSDKLCFNGETYLNISLGLVFPGNKEELIEGFSVLHNEERKRSTERILLET